MHNDQPTVPNLHYYDPREPGDLPPWPVAAEHPRGLDSAHARRGETRSLVLGMSLGANAVLLISVVVLLLLGHASLFAPGGSPGTSTLGVSSPSSALTSPTATSSTTALGGGWLRVTPSSVQLGCASGQRNQFVVLENTGPQTVQWRAHLSGSTNQPGVAVSPNQGHLAAGASAPLQIQNTTHADEQGVIRFEPATSDAGPAPSLGFTTVGC